MSSSTIRKAIGVVKDKTSIRIAKVVGNVAPDLEVLIVKATGHDNEPAEEKYIREILHLIANSRCYVGACVYNISKRLSKTHDWVVALKSLMLVHRLLVDGDPVFGQEIMYASRKGGARVLNMSDFRVEALSNYWDHSGFVKSYGMYLDQKLEFIAFERKLCGPDEIKDDIYGFGMSQKSKSYGDLYESVSRKEMKVAAPALPMKEMKADRLLERLDKMLRLIEKVLACRPAGSAKNSKMVIVALYLVLSESFRIYGDICEALEILLERFPEMEYANCVKTFDQYVIASKTIDKLVEFYGWSKELGVARASEFPDVQKVTDKVLGTLERFLIEKKNRLKKNLEKCCKQHGPLPLSAVVEQTTTEDLLDLKDDDIVHVKPLRLLSCGSNTHESDKVSATGWLTPGRPDWELALVESANNTQPNHMTNIVSGGLDSVTLNGIYDQGAAVTTQAPVLALPAPNKNVHPVDPRDPFAASLMVPPPQYVQLADLEKKQSFLAHAEKQVWQPYGMMLGQGPAGKMNPGGAATYNRMMEQQAVAGYTYAHY